MTNKKRRLGLTIPTSLYQKILKQSEYRGGTINSTCLEIFWDYFESKKDQESKSDKTKPA